MKEAAERELKERIELEEMEAMIVAKPTEIRSHK
jgi:hypothetical protein